MSALERRGLLVLFKDKNLDEVQVYWLESLLTITRIVKVPVIEELPVGAVHLLVFLVFWISDIFPVARRRICLERQIVRN